MEEETLSFVDRALELLEEKQYPTLRLLLNDQMAADINEFFEELPMEKIIVLYRLLPKELAAEVFVEMDPEQQEYLIGAFSDAELRATLGELYYDDTADIIEEMPANVVKRILNNCDPEMRKAVNELLKYPEDSAGSLMTTEFVRLKKNYTVEASFDLIRRVGIDKETIYTCYVTDEKSHLIGIVTVKDLLLAPLQRLIEDIMTENVISVNTLDDQEQIAMMFSKYDFIALPVVDNEDRLVGIITVDDAIDVLQEETEEDFAKMAAITPNDTVTLSVDVTNTGGCAGDEVVQIYVATPDSPASLERPAKRLKGFRRVTIPRGQTRTVSIDVNCADLWFWDMEQDRMTYDQGRYVFEFGSSSQDIRGRVSATMSGRLDRKLKTVWAACDASVLRIGQTAKGSFSACMNDDSFENGARGVWRSNNPAVATVAADGTVTAVSMGVATISCTVTAGGVTKEDSFAVKVMPELGLASLKVGGKAVSLGDAAQVSYLMKAGKAPKVEAVAADPAIRVAVKQADAVPGTAVVTLCDDATGDSRTVTVIFGTQGVSDSFAKPSLGSRWSWVREDPALWSLEDGALVLTAGKGDIAQAGNDAPNVLLQEANTDWTVDTRMRCFSAPAAPAQNAGLVAYESDDNFVKFVYAATFNFRRQPGAGPAAGQLQLLVEENGQQKSLASLSLDGIVGADNLLYLRLVKQGDSYTAWYSVDGRKYEKMGTAQAVLKDVRAGVLACEGAMPAMMRGFGGRGGMQLPAAAPLKVAFDDFKIVSRGRK